MSAPIWLAAMVAGTVVVMIAGRREDPEPDVPAAPVATETPWLTAEAAAEVIGPNGTLGPLFTGVVVGGTPPLPEVRARIAEFARTHQVAIDLEIVDDEVAAVRFEVTYGGCCGYEGVERLALRMDRPTRGGGCTSLPVVWENDWSKLVEDGVQLTASVRVNRLVVRWRRVDTLPELLERFENMLGTYDAAERNEEGQHRIEVPYPLLHDQAGGDLWVHVGSKGQRITEVSFSISDRREGPDRVREALWARWGTPRDPEAWEWHLGDRIISAGPESEYGPTAVWLRLR